MTDGITKANRREGASSRGEAERPKPLGALDQVEMYEDVRDAHASAETGGGRSAEDDPLADPRDMTL